MAGKRQSAEPQPKRRGLVIRDSFTMPISDYARIGDLKTRCIGVGIAIKKSELLRAGLVALEGLSDKKLSEVVGSVERIKTGRPPGKRKKRKKKG